MDPKDKLQPGGRTTGGLATISHKKGIQEWIQQVAAGMLTRPALVDGFLVGYEIQEEQRFSSPLAGVEVYKLTPGTEELCEITRLYGFPFSQQALQKHLEDGDIGYIARCEGRAIGYCCFRFNDFRINALSRRFALNPDEFYSYDAFILPEFRGRGISPFIKTVAREELVYTYHKRHGIAFILSNNRASLRSIAKNGGKRIARIGYFKLLGFRFHYLWSRRKWVEV